jgi:hypothetical protein
MTCRRWVFGIALGASALDVNAQALSDRLARLDDTRDSARAASFYRLLNVPPGAPARIDERMARLFVAYPGQRDLLASTLIRLLVRENAVFHSASNPRGEDLAANYYGDLIWAVASLNDPRAATALAGAIETGELATTGLARLGAAALPVTMNAARASDAMVRHSAMRVFGKLSAQRSQLALSSSTVSTVRQALLAALDDASEFVRAEAVTSLTGFSDQDARRRVARLVDEDASERVRRAARTWLDHIR